MASNSKCSVFNRALFLLATFWQAFATALQNDQKGCGTNFLIIMYGDEW